MPKSFHHSYKNSEAMLHINLVAILRKYPRLCSYTRTHLGYRAFSKLSPQQAAHLFVVALRNPNHYFTMHVINTYGNITVSPCIMHKAHHTVRLFAQA